MKKNELINEVINSIETLRIAYPEKDRFIDEVLECALGDIYDASDALTYIHTVNAVMIKLFDTIDLEELNDRDISDREYSEIITDIKLKAEEVDSALYDYIDAIKDEWLND